MSLEPGPDCGHACCNTRQAPHHDHFLSPEDCPACINHEVRIAAATGALAGVVDELRKIRQSPEGQALQERIAARLIEDKPILDKLAASEAIVEMITRRLASETGTHPDARIGMSYRRQEAEWAVAALVEAGYGVIAPNGDCVANVGLLPSGSMQVGSSAKPLYGLVSVWGAR